MTLMKIFIMKRLLITNTENEEYIEDEKMKRSLKMRITFINEKDEKIDILIMFIMK